MKPASKRVAVAHLQQSYAVGLTRSCRLLNISRSSYGYQSSLRDDEPLRTAIRTKAAERKRWGYRRLQTLLERDGQFANHKRIYRIYCEEGLQVRKRKRKRARSGRSYELNASKERNERWSMDFMHDSTASGRKIRLLNIVDDYTREAIWMEVATSISGAYVSRVLDQLIELRGKPESLLTDNGPEFAGAVLDAWTYKNGIKHNFIKPGKPNQNAYVESFNGRVRDECLNEHWWRNIGHAKETIENWRIDYNEVRPHSSLNKLTPAEFAKSAAPPMGGCAIQSNLQTNQNN